MQRENSPNEVQKWYPRGTNCSNGVLYLKMGYGWQPWCELLANGIVKDFLYDVYTLEYLINMEEQAKSFWLAQVLR